MRSMPQTRRTHTKSRGGCFECKRRKIKCNEQRPICSGCEKRLISCEYPSSGSSPCGGDTLRPLLQSGNSPRTNSPAPVSRTTIPASHQNGELPALPPVAALEIRSPLAVLKSLGKFNMEDMALWHQFVTQTAATISWAVESEIPHLSLSCDYLMHGVLSIAALHLAYLHPDQRERYGFLSTQHQDLAFGPFRIAMSNITEKNCYQVFAFSVLLVVLQYASSRCADFLLPSQEVSSGLANWILCIRGCVSITESSSHIKSGPFGSLVTQCDKVDLLTSGGTVFQQDEDDKSLEKLTRYLTHLPSIKASTTIAEMEAYTEAIFLLRKLLTASSKVTDSLSRRAFSSHWPARVSETFIRLLSEHRPAALAIMAHYCLLLKRCYSCWYMEHRAYDLFEAVRLILTEEWTPCIEHPQRVFRG